MSHTDYILEDISLNLLSGRGVDLPTYILYEYDKMLGTLFLVEPNYVLQKIERQEKGKMLFSSFILDSVLVKNVSKIIFQLAPYL